MAVDVTADADQSKVYGQLDPTYTYVSDPAVAFALPNGEVISFTGALARLAGETVAGSPYAINQGDLVNSNYNINFVANNFAITAKPLTITGTFTAFDKIYVIGNTDATINNNSLSLDGKVGTDVVNLTAVAAFEDANVGSDKTVSLTAASSIDNANYSIDPSGQSPAAPTTTADILDDNTPVITNPDNSTASAAAEEGDQRAYKVTDRGTGFSYAWSFVESSTTNVILFSSTNQVEVEWNETGTLRLTETYDNGSGNTVVRYGDLAVTVTRISVKGTVKYNRNNLNHTPLDGITVKLIPDAGTTLTTQTDATGYYEFKTVTDGVYSLEVSTDMTWGGGNSTDALAVQRRSIGMDVSFWNVNAVPTLAFDFDFRDKVAEVNLSGAVNAVDALNIKRRAIQLESSFNAGDWAFFIPGTVDQYFTNTAAGTAKISYTHEQVNPAEFNVLAMTYGDVNSSYTPSSGTKSFRSAEMGSVINTAKNRPVYLPVKIASENLIGAVTLKLKYNTDLLNVKDLKSNVPGLIYSISKGYINVAWSGMESLELPADGTLLTLIVDAKQEVNQWDDLFSIDSETQFADLECNELQDVRVFIDRLDTKSAEVGNDISSMFDFRCYPNPFRNQLKVAYTLPLGGQVQILVTNAMGEVVTEIENRYRDEGSYTLEFNPSTHNLSPGVYYFRIVADGGTDVFNKVIKVVNMK